MDTKPLPETYYEHGALDALNVVFYALVWIIIHALLQEYIWEVKKDDMIMAGGSLTREERKFVNKMANSTLVNKELVTSYFTPKFIFMEKIFARLPLLGMCHCNI